MVQSPATEYWIGGTYTYCMLYESITDENLRSLASSAVALPFNSICIYSMNNGEFSNVYARAGTCNHVT